ncbi:hypothetical protein Y032_0036g3251 [Ancylostoma ceylanicum]|uniref:Uncharacterized protein n=1 Tax=Ancylostoma ceylanicum TaxID=53326 RepID=A0A016ULB0_9BILA|nr:hypothetical protein Y032_0036g3251 [Ancylostoma ceylanicum]
MVQMGVRMHGQLIRVIYFHELLLGASASRRGDYTIMAFGPVLVSHATMNRRFWYFVSEDMSSQRHLPIMRPPELRSETCHAGVAGTQGDEQQHLLQ